MNTQTAQPQPSHDQNAAILETPGAAQPTQQSEKLEDQNVFYLLGVTDGTDPQREEFLDELQQVIWEDFLEYDVKLLLTQDEYGEFQKLLDKQQGSSLEQQEELVVYLEKLIPELEEIMLEKALELKADLFRERIAGMKEFFSGKDEQLQKLQRAEELLMQERWHSSASLLNEIE